MPYVRGEQRHALIQQVTVLYAQGKSIRTIGSDLGYSYGAIHAMLKSTGAQFRDRGYHGRVQQPVT